MADPVTLIAEVLYEHRHDWQSLKCHGCDWIYDGENDHIEHQAAVGAARLAEQHAIVELPGKCVTPPEWVGCLGAWSAGAAFEYPVSVWPKQQVALPDDIWVDPQDARKLAAALLAAANAAERTDRD